MTQGGNAPARAKLQPRYLVQETATKLRDMVFAREPGSLIGSLTDLASALGVGIVTVQQAARILEHEGLLDVRRGPGGGYYGKRPDEAALERSLASYLRMHPSSYGEMLDMTTLLFRELIAAAAECDDPRFHAELRALEGRIEQCGNEAEIGAFETEFQDHLFRVVDRPLFGLLTRVTLNLYAMRPGPKLSEGREGVRAWRLSRHRIIGAILTGDRELARFEGTRARRGLLDLLHEQQARNG